MEILVKVMGILAKVTDDDKFHVGVLMHSISPWARGVDWHLINCQLELWIGNRLEMDWVNLIFDNMLIRNDNTWLSMYIKA